MKEFLRQGVFCENHIKYVREIWGKCRKYRKNKKYDLQICQHVIIYKNVNVNIFLAADATWR